MAGEREASLRLKGENGIMRKKFNALQKDIEAQKEEIKNLFEQVLFFCVMRQALLCGGSSNTNDEGSMAQGIAIEVFTCTLPMGALLLCLHFCL